MVRKKPVRVGIAGCGLIAQWHHIPSFIKMRDVKLVAVCDKDIALIDGVARRFNINGRYTDFTEMLTSEELDIVDICTPPKTHADLSIRAIEAGCDVLVEKPMALSLKEFDQIAGACKRTKARICPVHHELFEPAIIKVRSLVGRGHIGDLIGIDIMASSRRDAALLRNKEHWSHQLPAGILSESLPHPIYLAAAFLGSIKPVAINITKHSTDDGVVADEARIIFEGTNGKGGISYSCNNSPKDKVIIDIYGTKKNLRIDLWNSVITEYGIGGENRCGRALENLNQIISIFACSVLTTLYVVSGKFHSGHYTLIERFVESVRHDTEPPVTMEEAKQVIQVLEKVAQHSLTIG